MAQEEVDKWKKDIKDIVDLVTKRQISEILTTWFELEEEPEIIALNRGITSIKGFAKISKKVFMFSIIFLKENGIDKLEIILAFGKNSIAKTKEISIEKSETEIDIYLSENKQYLFSVYF